MDEDVTFELDEFYPKHLLEELALSIDHSASKAVLLRMTFTSTLLVKHKISE